MRTTSYLSRAERDRLDRAENRATLRFFLVLAASIGLFLWLVYKIAAPWGLYTR